MYPSYMAWSPTWSGTSGRDGWRANLSKIVALEPSMAAPGGGTCHLPFVPEPSYLVSLPLCAVGGSSHNLAQIHRKGCQGIGSHA